MLARLALVAAVAVSIVLAIALYFSLALPDHDGLGSTVTPAGSQGGSITIVAISGNSLMSGTQYKITRISEDNSSSFTVGDGSARDSDSASGVVKVDDIENGNYSITQIGAPPGHALDGSPRFVSVAGKPVVVTFSDASSSVASQDATQPRSITYTAKFECGTISGSEGPLRPGRYDTDISMINKQDSQVKILWSASVIHGQETNSILQNIDPRQSTSLVCKDLTLLLKADVNFFEGFVFIEVPFDAQTLGQLATNGSLVVGNQQDLTNVLDVQVFYTANALDVLPHEVYVDKISFTILNDTSGKLPPGLIGKELDVTVPSNVSMVSDPTLQVKAVLTSQYGLSVQEQMSLQIKIDAVDGAVSATIDDHAISLSRVPPQVVS